jgi:hypothetical protein
MAHDAATRRAGNITIIPLPAKCPERNPQENVWEFMRDNWLSNRIFTRCENRVDRCPDAWNKLIQQPWTVMSIGLPSWAHRFRSESLGIDQRYWRTVPDGAE